MDASGAHIVALVIRRGRRMVANGLHLDREIAEEAAGHMELGGKSSPSCVAPA